MLKRERLQRTDRSKLTLAKLDGILNIKTLEEFEFEFAGGVPKQTIQNLAGLSFVERGENVVFVGPSGVGKTHIAIALATQA